jgi:hypothetical protein
MLPLTGITIMAAVAVSGVGADLVGKPCPEWSNEKWVQGGPLRLGDLRGKVVLVPGGRP